MRLPVTFHQVGGPNHIYLTSYKDWLAKQTVTSNTSRVYYSRIKQFLHFIQYTNLGDKPLSDPAGINKAMALYLDFLKQSQKGNSTVNANVNALKNFSLFLGIEETQLKRERCYDKSTKMLTLGEQERFLQSVEQQESARDKAIALVLFSTGLRIGECARLNIDNIGAGAVSISLAAGTTIYLNQQSALALRQWLEERRKLPNAQTEAGLWLTKQGRRLKIAGLTCVIERIGWDAKLVLSVETLRRTRLTQATDLLDTNDLASKFGGYVSKATIKRYGIALSIASAGTPLEH
jgi:integrase